MRPQTHLSVESMCRLAQVSRAGFYRHWEQRAPRSEETELRAEVQRIALTHRRNYGYRRVVGWALDQRLDAALPVVALRQAIDARQPAPGLVHHSDRGVQYASAAYAELLAGHGIVPSMSRPGNPYDNAQCESFIKTLKQEEVYTRRYRDRADLEAHIEHFIERYYNRRRLHSALDYRTPEDRSDRAE
jgi:putative transposase